MAIEYIGTPDIKVFPSAFRNGDEEAKRTTEENLIKFNRLSSFSDNLEQMFIDPDDSDYIIFNIHGYWFRCLKTSIPLGTNLFAYIKLEKAGVGWKLSAIPESALDDEDSKFTGLGFDTTVPDDTYADGDLIVKYYKLKVRDENGDIIEQKLKLDSTEIRNGDSTKSISEEFTVGNLTAESVETIQLKVSTITSKNEDDIIAIDKNIKTAENKTIDIDGDVDINGNITIGSGGLITGAKNINMVGEVNVPISSKIYLGANKEISINNSEIKLGSISIESSTSGNVNPMEFLVDNSATTKTQIHMPKPVSGTSAILHLPTDVAFETVTKEYIWAQKSNTGRTNNWYKLGDGSTAGDIIQAQPDGSIAAKINGVSIKSVGSDVEITGPSDEIIRFPSYKYGTVAFMGDIPAIPEAIKNPKSLTIKRNNTTLGIYDGSSAKEINITPQWTHLGTARHDDIGSAASFPETAGDFSEYMIIYTNSIDGKYTDMTEVVYGPVALLDGMTLPGYEYSTIGCSSSYITIDWWDFGSGVETKTYIIVYAR